MRNKRIVVFMQNNSIAKKVMIILLLMSILFTCLLSGCQTELPAGTNQTTQTGNDETTQVGNDETTQAGNDQTTQAGIDQTVLTQEQREAISAAYSESQNGILYWFHIDGLGAYYLGQFDGCIVFYNLRTWSPGKNADLEYGQDIFGQYGSERYRPLNFTIARIPFSPGFRNQLCAYKDGEVAQLQTAYLNKKWISKEAVEQVKTAYDTFIQHLITMGESAYLEREKKFKTLIFSISDDPGYLQDDVVYQNFMSLSESKEYQLFIEALKEQEE